MRAVRRACVSDVKPIAFYPPQFHAIRENNAYGGPGFSD
jgi:hypothetical protein